MSGWMKQLEDWIKVDWVFKEMSKWKKWMDYEWINEWMNKWMNEQILERWQNWMLYSWRKAHLFILDSIKQSESGNKKCKNRSFLVILTPRCVAICAVTWSFPFIWPTCDSRTYHWFNSKGQKKFRVVVSVLLRKLLFRDYLFRFYHCSNKNSCSTL